MPEGIRKEKNQSERISRAIITNEEQFIQSLKIFANTSIVGSQGAQAGGSSGGPSGLGNYLRKDGDIMDGVFATRPSVAIINANQIDIRKLTGTNYTSKVFLVPEAGSGPDELNFILGGSTSNTVVGAEFPGQWLIIQPIAGATITINNDPSTIGDASAVPPFNIRTPDGNPVVLKDEQAVLLNYDSTSAQWSFIGAPGTAIAGDACFPELDLGTVSGAQTIFFNRNRFVRMEVEGNTMIDFDTSEMVFGCLYKLTVEVLQDGSGGNIVTFDDAPFENSVTPKVFKAANRYTSIRFYAYKLDAEGTAVRIFAFEEFQDFSQEFFDGYIQATMITDQTANLGAGNHVEFNQAIATDNTIVVSVGSGQNRGRFTNFEVGHLYQCEAFLSIESLSQTDPELTFQLFNVTKAQFFGSQGRCLAVSGTEKDSSLPVAKGFFVADAISDTIEVRIKSMFGVDSLKAGDQSAEQMSFVIIKDCGVAGIDNLPGEIEPAPEPTTPLVILPNKGYAIGHAQYSGVGINYRSMGGDPGIGILASNRVPAMGSGLFKFCRTNVHVTGNGSLNLFTQVNGVNVLVDNFPANVIAFNDSDLLDRAFVKDDLIGIAIQRSSSTGTVHLNTWLELEYSNIELWAYGPRIFGAQGVNRFCSLIDFGIHSQPSGPNFNTRNDHQRELGRSGTILDFVYYGTAPAGSGTTIFSIEVNGVSVFDSADVPAHGGFSIDRFDGVNIELDEHDLVNVKMNGRSGTNLDGIFGCRIRLD